MGVLVQYGNYLSQYHAKTNFIFNWGSKSHPEGSKIIAKALSENRKSLLEIEAKQLLSYHHAPVTIDKLVQSAEEAIEVACEMEQPVVLKIASPDILHKSDVGGVCLDLKGKTEIRKSYKRIIKNARKYNPTANIKGVNISPMVKGGVEVIIGTKIDDQFGPVIMYGLGGVMVEILKDVSFRVLPISRHSATTMIEETKSYPILNGVRGAPPYDKKAIIRLLLLCSEIVESYPQIAEMDLNPVIVHEIGLSVVDARIILK
jgi:acetyltransferase